MNRVFKSTLICVLCSVIIACNTMLHNKRAVTSTDLFLLAEERQSRGNDAFVQKNYAEAERQYKLAISSAEEYGEKQRANRGFSENIVLSSAIEALAKVYEATERYDEAEALYNRAVRILEKIREKEPDEFNPALLEYGYYDLCLFYINRSEINKALPVCRKSLQTSKSLPNGQTKYSERVGFYCSILQMKGFKAEAQALEERASP